VVNGHEFYRTDQRLLTDIQGPQGGDGAELFVVEGDSAAQAVVRARNPQRQAVFAMQGKPLNAWKASAAAVAANPWYAQLIETLGAGWGSELDCRRCRFDQIILLCDPDADGIHCEVLLLLFFVKWFPELVERGRVAAVRPPLWQFTIPATRQIAYAYSDEHARRIRTALQEQGVTEFTQQRFRGLASLSGGTLAETCVAPASRKLRILRNDDAETALQLMKLNSEGLGEG
jgi:DNA gyrase subunit B/topoisomerase-4 subunit B